MNTPIRFHPCLQTMLLISFSVATFSIRVSSHQEATSSIRNLQDPSPEKYQKHYSNLTNQIMILLTTSICFMLLFFCCIRMIVSYNGGMENNAEHKSHEEIVAELNGVQRRQLLDLVLNPKRFVEYKNSPKGLEEDDIEMSNHSDHDEKNDVDAPVTPPQLKDLKDEEMATPPTVQMRTPSPRLGILKRGGKDKYEAVLTDSPGGCLRGSDDDVPEIGEDKREEEEQLPNVPSLYSKQEKQSDFVTNLSPSIVSTLQPKPQKKKEEGNNLELGPGDAAALAHPLSDLVLQTPAKVNDSGKSDGNEDEDSFNETENMCAICLDDYDDEDDIIESKQCVHIFHKECIEQWLGRRTAGFQCPECRVHLVTNEELQKAASSIKQLDEKPTPFMESLYNRRRTYSDESPVFVPDLT